MPTDAPEKLAPSALAVSPPPPRFESPGSSSVCITISVSVVQFSNLGGFDDRKCEKKIFKKKKIRLQV